MSGSGNYGLTLIPRATQPNVSYSEGNMRMGTVMTIILPTASSSFTHYVNYGFGKVGETIANNAKGSVSWMIPKDLAYQIPTAVGGQGYIGVDTYNGSSYIGTKTCSLDTIISDDM